MMAAIQCLADRMGYYEHNGTDPYSRHATIVLHSLQVFGLQLALLHHLLRTVTGQRMRGDEEELVLEEKTERDIVDSRAVQSAKLEPLHNNAADFRIWKNP